MEHIERETEAFKRANEQNQKLYKSSTSSSSASSHTGCDDTKKMKKKRKKKEGRVNHKERRKVDLRHIYEKYGLLDDDEEQQGRGEENGEHGSCALLKSDFL
eukprot:jgi/Bigna1/133965/aug1.23_g8673